MSQFKAIYKFATNSVEKEDEFTKIISENIKSSELTDALKKMKAQEYQATVEAAALEIMTVLKKAEAVKLANVTAIRESRRIETQSLSNLKAIERATKYAMATNNYLPLARLSSYGIDSSIPYELYVVPDSFEQITEKKEVSKKK